MTTLPHLTAADVAARAPKAVRVREGRWKMPCFGHEDRHPSLYADDAPNGTTLLICRAGCEFSKIVGAAGIDPRQLFAPDPSWKPSTGYRWVDPQAKARREYDQFLARYRIPPAPRLHDEMVFTGRVMLGGTAAIPRGFDSDRLKTPILRILAAGMAQLASQGTPRRWFSAYAIGREVDAGIMGQGCAKRLGVYGWARMCRALARDEESGKLAQARMNAFRKANAARSEKLEGNKNASNGKPKNSRGSREPEPSRESKQAAAVAEAANVSPATVKRVQKLRREDPEAFEVLARTGGSHG